MTEKHWFIYRGDHHLGPFTFQEILDKVKLSEISDDELTWCEGNSDWLPAREQPAIRQALYSEQEASALREQQERAKAQAIEAKKQEERIRQEAERERIQKEKALAELRERERLEQERLEKERAAKERLAKERLAKESLPDEPPPLPPLPIEDELEEEIEEEVEEEPVPEFEEESFEQEELVYQEQNYEDDVEEEDQKDFEDEVTGEHQVLVQEEELESVSGLRLYGAFFLSILGLGFFIYLISQLFTEQRQLFNVAGRDKDALYNVMNRPFKGVPIHRMRPTKDLNSLWLGTNFPDEAILYMTLKSIPGRTLAQGEGPTSVEVQSVAHLRGGAALFDQLEVLKGETLHIGEYAYEIHGVRVGLKGKLSHALGDKALFKEMRSIRQKDQEFQLKGTLLLSPYAQDEFEEKLKQHLQFVDKSVVRPLKDRAQRYTTFIGLLERMETLYTDIMKRITKGSSIKMFEDRYNEEVGPFLRDLIIDNNRLYLSLRNLQPQDSKAYEELMNYGKDIGIIASDMVTKTRRVKKLSTDKTQWLLNHFAEEVDKLRKQGQKEKARIKNLLAPYVGKEEAKEEAKEDRPADPAP